MAKRRKLTEGDVSQFGHIRESSTLWWWNWSYKLTLTQWIRDDDTLWIFTSLIDNISEVPEDIGYSYPFTHSAGSTLLCYILQQEPGPIYPVCETVFFFLMMFVQKNVLDVVCKQTNTKVGFAYKGDWKDTDDIEMKIFIRSIIVIVLKISLKMKVFLLWSKEGWPLSLR